MCPGLLTVPAAATDGRSLRLTARRSVLVAKQKSRIAEAPHVAVAARGPATRGSLDAEMELALVMSELDRKEQLARSKRAAIDEALGRSFGASRGNERGSISEALIF